MAVESEYSEIVGSRRTGIPRRLPRDQMVTGFGHEMRAVTPVG